MPLRSADASARLASVSCAGSLGLRRAAEYLQPRWSEVADESPGNRQTAIERGVAKHDRHAANVQLGRMKRLDQRQTVVDVAFRLADRGIGVDPDGDRRRRGAAAAPVPPGITSASAAVRFARSCESFVRLDDEPARALEQRPFPIDVVRHRQLGDADQAAHDLDACVPGDPREIEPARVPPRRDTISSTAGAGARNRQVRREDAAVELGVAEKAELRIDDANAVGASSASFPESSRRARACPVGQVALPQSATTASPYARSATSVARLRRLVQV